MKQLLTRISRRVITSIAFIPTIMGVVSIIFALFINSFEYSNAVIAIKDEIRGALVTDPESARMILATILGGIISLMVFSFTMVMAVLNRATATLSPRVLPGLVSKKFHQIVLGFYIATIIFSLLLIVNVKETNEGWQVPSLGVLLSMVAAVTCLGLFVYFIHSISVAIQVDNILETILRSTLQNIHQRIKQKDYQKEEGHDKVDQWFDIKADKAGYFKHTHSKSLITFLCQEDMILKINAHRGLYILPGYPYLSVSKKITDEKKLSRLNNNIEFYNEEYVTDHYTYGFKQITEIAVKALSPGINDPGTALKALDLLGLLFTERMKISEFEIKRDRYNEVRVIYHELSFEKLLYDCIAPISEYGKKDTLVIIKLLEMIKNLLHADEKGIYTDILLKEIKGIIYDAREGNRNFRDKNAINDAIESINNVSEVKIIPL